MFRIFCIAAAVGLSLSASAQAGSWHLGEPVAIYPLGTRPSVWNGTVAFLDGNGGPVMYYDGVESHLIFEPVEQCWEPMNCNGSIAWRHNEGSASSNEIFRWDGESTENVSNAPGVIDCDLAGGCNGDLIWSKNHTTLWYYDAATGVASSLGVQGVHPALYITDDGIATYAYQHPDTDEVWFFDGSETHLLGTGNCNGAYPSTWDGAVAWVGESEVGSYFTKGEIYYWKEGETIQITNDDDQGGIADEYPSLWRDTVVWSRGVDGLFSPKLFVSDTVRTWQLTFTNAKYPSLHRGKLAWAGDYDLYLADLYPGGDLDFDHDVDIADLAQLLGHYGLSEGVEYGDGDVDEDGDVDMADLAELLGQYGYSLD
jgi:hypothetical protein